MKHLILLLTLLSATHAAIATTPEDDKEKALLVLQTKCNSCHVRNNPFRIFKERNMDRNAKDIYKQVFVKGRMPLGNDVKLTEGERETLKKWLEANM
ncbi:hypothetical protein [Chitinophaga qingshengii]|uniref:Cytochrome c domain-containing protein n=1 Tax=Chitinophaga qingshengii TaxID=1569794 RepID=A0ABR7TJU8_9BACT|nr:hypothetical protein [Chitinophaga qingshengii]MBC9929803.1 hypothetical protein [Chitinophaga qingshengii]